MDFGDSDELPHFPQRGEVDRQVVYDHGEPSAIEVGVEVNPKRFYAREYFGCWKGVNSSFRHHRYNRQSRDRA